MKYLYYYMWIGHAKFAYTLSKPFYWFRMKIRNTPLEFKKIDDKEFQKRIKDVNTNVYHFPDGVTHWYAGGWTLGVFMILFFFIPLFTTDFFGDYIINSGIKCAIYLIILAAIVWYLVYIKKDNKEWLKKKINKKSKDFYLKMRK